ncbi:MAG: hypothetical protein V4561_12670 [Bacteroidota bacterium]
MKWKKVFLIAFLLSSRFYWSAAQNSFIEGELTYTVSIESNNIELGKTKSSGTLTLMLKGNCVVKVLELNTGFKNTIIYNHQKKASYSLRNIGHEKVALLLEPDQLSKKQNRCSTLRVEELSTDIQTILNFKTARAKLHCNNLKPIIIYYTQDWLISSPYLFDEFSTFHYLPLLFDINNEDGSIIHFELKKIEAKPMDNSLFEVPKDYKIITSEEYNSWQH